jgi:mannose-6-phosphate isomerase
MSKNNLRIDILGTSITISTDENPDYLDLLLDKYRNAVQSVQEKTGLKDPLKTAIITGFLLCDDLEKAGRASPNDQEPLEAEQLTLGMISRLDEIIYPQELCTGTAVKTGTALFKLQNTIKNYDWGSAEWLPAFLDQKNISRIPWAELWLDLDPSQPNYEKLPFLFKVLAAEKPLSAQVHPKAAEARDGFERENREGIKLDAPHRNYVDPNQKNEILCALSPVVALCGFRESWEITTLMEILSIISPLCMDKLILALKDKNPTFIFLTILSGLESETVKELASSIKTQLALLKNDFPEYKREWELCVYLSAYYPQDPFIVAPLFLNVIELAPGEAMYIPAGTFHSYIKGMGIELMTHSDNVLRGGLTSKHVDTEEVLKNLDFSAYKPEIIPPPDPELIWHTYPAEVEEFSLSVMRGKGASTSYPKMGPSILLITEGSAAVNEMVLSKGESVFIPAGEKPTFSGTFTAFVASTAIA